MKKFIFIFFVFGSLFAQEQKPEPVTLHRTEIYNLTSKENGFTYPVYIALPGSYNYSDQDYPVVYMLDGYSSFGIMVEEQRLMAFNKEVPEAIIVGISSEGGSKEFIYNRSRDYTPTHISPDQLPDEIRRMTPASGGASKFLAFIKKELIPFVESKYRCKKNDRTFVGHSYGGLFGFYVLFTQPDIFNRYVMISPVLLWDNEYILKTESKFAEKHYSLKAIVYTAIGSQEGPLMIDPWNRLIDSMKEHNYSGLAMKEEIAEDETHYTIIPFFVTHGLKYVFSK